GGLRREEPRARELVARTWVSLAAVLGGYAVVEAFVLHHNPVWDVTGKLGGGGVDQVWATYRATTTLGHPLENAGFFSLGASLALARAVRSGSRRDALAVVLALAGLAATGSRGAGAAVLLGVVWVLVAEARRAPRRRVAAVAFTLVLAAAGAGVVQLTRSGSAEADSSTQYRAATLQSGLASVREHPWLGVGPGASDVVKQEQGGSLATLSYENGWLEAAISDGLPFLVVMAGMWGTGLVAAARRRHVGAGAALAVSVLVMGSSNVLEGGREGLLRFGLLLGLAWAPRAQTEREYSP
ncbi:MAG: O-antigen ligase family protein, partial [Mycobacteriales bacterium]